MICKSVETLDDFDKAEVEEKAGVVRKKSSVLVLSEASEFLSDLTLDPAFFQDFLLSF